MIAIVTGDETIKNKTVCHLNVFIISRDLNHKTIRTIKANTDRKMQLKYFHSCRHIVKIEPYKAQSKLSKSPKAMSSK